MAQITTTFAKLALKNPFIVSSSGLTNSVEKIKKLEEAGAAAVVLKSIFEEQITMQTSQLEGYDSPESAGYLATYVRSHALNEHIALIKGAKRECHIPVIASINCYSDSEWVEFAKHLEAAGADAIELNILSLQTDKEYKYGSFEQLHIDTLRDIKKVVKIPVIMKLGSNFTNPVALIYQLYANGADAVVLFNRFYQPDINLQSLSFISTNVMSSSNELADRLRWTAIASSEIPQMDYAVSGGVHTGKSIIKSILAGACAVEACTTIYQSGEKQIGIMLRELEQWMDANGYANIEQFRGKMNAAASGAVNPFERTQFMKYFSNHQE